MFCSNCGTEIKENARYCIKCGNEVNRENYIEQKKKCLEKEPKEETNTAFAIGIIITILIIMIGVIIAIKVGEKRILDNLSIETQKKQDVVEDVEETGGVNVSGNIYSNLGYQCGIFYSTTNSGDTGRVTLQGDEIFFYEMGKIYMLDEEDNKIAVCSVDNAQSLNVIGDEIYYLEGGCIYCTSKDGSSITKLISDVNSPFFVYNDAIYYVTRFNVTATSYEYYICKYDIKENEMQKSINMGEKIPTIVGVEKDDVVACYYRESVEQDSDNPTLFSVCDRLVSIGFTEGVIRSKSFTTNGVSPIVYDFYAIYAKDYIYVNRTHSWNNKFGVDSVIPSSFTVESQVIKETNVDFKNCYNNDWIVYGEIEGQRGLYLISEDTIGNLELTLDNARLIIQEKYDVSEVYVAGDYIYYTLDTSGYKHGNLYRVKIDGTSWEDI